MVKHSGRVFGTGCRARGKRWTPEKDAVARTMREAGATYEQIAEVVDLSPQTVGRRLSGGGRAERESTGRIHYEKVNSLPISIETEDDRECRYNSRALRNETELARGIITSSFFGDPPPEFSALAEWNRKRAGA